MDLSTIEGLNEEQISAIQVILNSEVSGLKSKNDELLKEKREAAEKAAEAERIAEAERQEKELEVARKANDLASLEETLTKKFDAKDAESLSKLQSLQEVVKLSKQSAVISEIASEFISPEAAKLVLKSLVIVSLNDDNTTSTEYKGFDGAVVATDSKQFIEWASKNESLAPLMKPIDSAGGGANGSNGSNAGHKNPKDMTSEERIQFKKRDPEGFKRAFNLT